MECTGTFTLQFGRQAFSDDQLCRGVVLDMSDYFHDVIGVVHHLAEVDDVAAFHRGKVVPAVFLAADLERRMPVLPVWGMVKRVSLVIAHRTDANPFKKTDDVDSLDFPEIHCHVQFLNSVNLFCSYLYSRDRKSVV